MALDSGSEGDGSQPEWLKDKAASVDNAAKRRTSKTAARPHPDSEVQDLTGANFTSRQSTCCILGLLRSLLNPDDLCLL